MALMGHGSLKRGDLLLGSSDGTMSMIDMRAKADEAIMREEETFRSRGIGKHRIVGMETSDYDVLAGYADATVRLWDVRKMSRSVNEWQGRARKASSSSDHGSIRSTKSGSFQRKSRTRDQEPASFFAGSLRHRFFITDNRNELWAANFERKQLIKEYYPFEVQFKIN